MLSARKLRGPGCPLEPSEIIGGSGLQVLQGCASVLTRSGKDVSAIFRRGGRIAVDKALEFGARAAILKERSPSCGIRSVYDGSFSGLGSPWSGSGRCGPRLCRFIAVFEEALPEEGLMVDYQEVTAKIVAWLKEKVSAAGAKAVSWASVAASTLPL